MKETLKSHVESKIFKGYMIIGNLTQEEFKVIDDYCKLNFEDNRRQMILNLLRYYDGDTAVKLLDDKLYLIYEELTSRIEVLEKILQAAVPKENDDIKKPVWKGFKAE